MSRRAEREVKPTRSAKRTLTTRRSSRVGVAPTVWRSLPHCPQNLKFGVDCWPHDGQVSDSDWPHSPQRR